MRGETVRAFCRCRYRDRDWDWATMFRWETKHFTHCRVARCQKAAVKSLKACEVYRKQSPEVQVQNLTKARQQEAFSAAVFHLPLRHGQPEEKKVVGSSDLAGTDQDHFDQEVGAKPSEDLALLQACHDFLRAFEYKPRVACLAC